MTISAISAQEIAEQQLLAALRLWAEKDYVSSLTLAGAAEEILGKRLRKLGREPSFDQLKNLIVALAKSEGDNEPNTEQIVANLLNDTKNALKHYAGDESLNLDLRADASEILERALANHHVLTGVILEEAMPFWADVSAA